MISRALYQPANGAPVAVEIDIRMLANPNAEALF